VGPVGLHLNLRWVYDTLIVTKTCPEGGTNVSKHVVLATPAAENSVILAKNKININCSE
jgi:hypothetical protein